MAIPRLIVGAAMLLAAAASQVRDVSGDLALTEAKALSNKRQVVAATWGI